MTPRYNQLIKVKFLVLFVAVTLLGLSFFGTGKSVHASRVGPDPSYTNVPALGTFPAESNCTTCHFTGGSNPLNASGGTFQILDAPASYNPGQEYTIKVSLSRTGIVRFGFQITALDESGNPAGTLTATDTTRTQKIQGDPFSVLKDRFYIEHTTTGSAAVSSGLGEWTFKWTAPATRGGKITFYASGNAANNLSNQTGDFIYTTTAVMRPNVVSVNAASSDPTPKASNSGISSAYGVDLATAIATASGDADPNTPGIQLPTTLNGTTVKVRDSLNVERNATLFFVSPNQVNYLLPSLMANGNATVTITSGNGAVSTGTLPIATVAPGIFTVNQGGTGLAAAQIQRVRNGNTIAYEDVATGPVASPVAIPIEWKDPGDQLYLIIYGTGFRQRSDLSTVVVTVKGASQQVVYTAGHADYAGLDQINVLLDKALAGSGEVNVTLTVDGVAANTVKINFK